MVLDVILFTVFMTCHVCIGFGLCVGLCSNTQKTFTTVGLQTDPSEVVVMSVAI